MLAMLGLVQVPTMYQAFLLQVVSRIFQGTIDMTLTSPIIK